MYSPGVVARISQLIYQSTKKSIVISVSKLELLERLSIECRKIIDFGSLSNWLAPVFQSDPDPIATRSHTFSRALRQLHVITPWCDFFAAVSVLWLARVITLVLVLQRLRWLRTVSSTFQDVDFDGSLLPHFINWCYNHGIKTLPNHRWTCWYQFRDTIGYHSNAMTC